MVARARAEPGKLNWAAVTGLNDLLFSGFLAQEHIDITKVPYRNAVDAAKDLGVFNVAGALPFSIAPAIAPAILAIGHGGGSYSVLGGSMLPTPRPSGPSAPRMGIGAMSASRTTAPTPV